MLLFPFKTLEENTAQKNSLVNNVKEIATTTRNVPVK
jgi:hypothetical protein